MSNDGGPAYPVNIKKGEIDDFANAMGDAIQNPGMTLLDYFAGIALPLKYDQIKPMPIADVKAKGYRDHHEAAAVESYALAQAMVDVRSKWLAEEIRLTDQTEEPAAQTADSNCVHRWRDVFAPGQAKAQKRRCVECGAEAGIGVY